MTENVLQNKSFNTVGVKTALLLLLFGVAYWVPLKALVQVWLTNDDYSYGFLIPLVTVYLLWDKKETVKAIRFNTDWRVLPVLFLLLLISVYAVLGSSGNLSRPLIPILILGFAAFCFGLRSMRTLLFPLGFLIFMVPLPAILDRTLGVWLKAVSSSLGGAIIQLFGISVYVRGNVIDLGVTQLEVVDACSGLRFILPLLAMGCLYAWLFEKSTWKRVVLVVSALPVAVLTNGLRIGITGILTDKYGEQVAQGFFHDFSGWAIFMVALVILVLIGRALKLFPEKQDSPDKQLSEEHTAFPSGGNDAGFYMSGVLLGIVAFLALNTQTLPPFTIQGGLERFPLTFDGWQGRQEIVDPEIVEKSGAEASFSATYTHPGERSVSLYLGYRGSAFLEHTNFFHSPTVCLRSTGWKATDTSTHDIKNVAGFGDITVSQMVIEYMGDRQLVYFWFQTKKWATHDKNINRFHLSLHALTGDNTHDLFIRPITPFPREETLSEAQRRMDRFIQAMMPVLLEFLDQNQATGA
ncbi:MAG: EpsI family protein [Thermodesulfobacteriota bacterium]|nr:EpsI family protein [Thermodesulfobacteriota bacterium]